MKISLFLMGLITIVVQNANAFVVSGHAPQTSPRIFAIKFQTHDGKPMVAFQIECVKYKNVNGKAERYYENCHTYAMYDQNKVEQYLINSNTDLLKLEEVIKALQGQAKTTSDATDLSLLSVLGGPVTFAAGWLYAFANTVTYSVNEAEILDNYNAVAVLLASEKRVGFYVNFKEFHTKLVNELEQIYKLY